MPDTQCSALLERTAQPSHTATMLDWGGAEEHHDKTEAMTMDDTATLLLDLANIANVATANSGVATERLAKALLDDLLRACSAQRGALSLVSTAVSAITSHVSAAHETLGNVERVLAIAQIDAANVRALINGGHPDANQEFTVSCILALPLGHLWQLADARTQAPTPAAQETVAAVLLGWASKTDADTFAATASQWLATVGVAVVTVLNALLASERIYALEAAAAAHADTLREVEAARSDWQQALDAIDDPISIVTPDFRVVRANAAYVALFGEAAIPLSTHRCFTYTLTGDIQTEPCVECPLPQTLISGQPGFAQRERLAPNGVGGKLERRVYQTWTYPARNEAGTVDHVVEILKDVTEHERLRAAMSQAEALKEADRLKAELLGTVSHELRSPLAAIKGYAATLLRHERRLPRGERQDFLRAIQEASDRLEVIINRLLEMSQLETGTTIYHRVPVAMMRLVREAITILQTSPRADSPQPHNVTITTTGATGEGVAEMPFVIGDPRLLRVVLDNLLENAVKYSPDRSEIKIDMRRVTSREFADFVPQQRTAPSTLQSAEQRASNGVDAMLEIRVTDQGKGIPAPHLGRIFDRFHRVDTRLTRDVDGLGLGLAICKRIVELHQGMVWAESQPGQGSVFHVVLPLYPAVETDGPLERT